MRNVICKFLFTFLIIFTIGYSYAWSQNKIKKEILNDKVEHWYHLDNKNQFVKLFEKIFSVVLPLPPFEKSVAFLVGVSKYKHLGQLPSVKNDLIEMRKLLLKECAFNEVYIVSDDNVNRDLIEGYMKEKLPNSIGNNGRLLFYFSGHGADGKGNTGYMQFNKAKHNVFYGNEVLAINDIDDWCNEIDIKHMLFILDCCASGLAFSTKSGDEDCRRVVLKTLSGNGSRFVLTAGSADQEAFALKSRKEIRHGVFTRAFLNSFRVNDTDLGKCSFITISEIYSNIEREVAKFVAKYQKKMTPRIWSLQDIKYNGTFIFLHHNLEDTILPEEYAKVLNISLPIKGVKEKIIDVKAKIKIMVSPWADVWLDEKYLGINPPYRTLEVSEGKHVVKFQSKKLDKSYTFDFDIKSGEAKEIHMIMDTGEFNIIKKK